MLRGKQEPNVWRACILWYSTFTLGRRERFCAGMWHTFFNFYFFNALTLSEPSPTSRGLESCLKCSEHVAHPPLSLHPEHPSLLNASLPCCCPEMEPPFQATDESWGPRCPSPFSRLSGPLALATVQPYDSTFLS